MPYSRSAVVSLYQVRSRNNAESNARAIETLRHVGSVRRHETREENSLDIRLAAIGECDARRRGFAHVRHRQCVGVLRAAG